MDLAGSRRSEPLGKLRRVLAVHPVDRNKVERNRTEPTENMRVSGKPRTKWQLQLQSSQRQMIIPILSELQTCNAYWICLTVAQPKCNDDIHSEGGTSFNFLNICLWWLSLREYLIIFAIQRVKLPQESRHLLQLCFVHLRIPRCPTEPQNPGHQRQVCQQTLLRYQFPGWCIPLGQYLRQENPNTLNDCNYKKYLLQGGEFPEVVLVTFKEVPNTSLITIHNSKKLPNITQFKYHILIMTWQFLPPRPDT